MVSIDRKQTAWSGAVLVALACAGCGPTDPTTLVLDPGPLNKTFAVSDHFTPSGFMGDGEFMGKVTMDVDNENCKARPAGAAGYCYRFTYNEGTVDWAGVYWVFPANNWGTRPGRAIDGSKFKSVRFSVATNYDPCTSQEENVAAKAKYLEQHKNDDPATGDPGGYQFVPPNPWFMNLVVFAGGIAGANKQCVIPGYPYVDCLPPAADGSRQAFYTLWTPKTTTEWTRLHLNISDQTSVDNGFGWPTTYDHLLGAFGFAIEYPAKPQASAGDDRLTGYAMGNQGTWRGSGKQLEIYIDDVVWETDPVPAGNDQELLNAQLNTPLCPSIVAGIGTPDAGAPPPISDAGTGAD